VLTLNEALSGRNASRSLAWYAVYRHSALVYMCVCVLCVCVSSAMGKSSH
jgi:hypothetical protein